MPKKKIDQKPSKIKVGPYDFSITYYGLDEFADRHNDYGLTKIRELEIALCGEVPPQQLADTFIHEVLHAVWFAMHISREKEIGQEAVILPMATGLTQVWRDNPKAFEWWKGLLNG